MSQLGQEAGILVGRRAMQTDYFLILREAMFCTVAVHLRDAELLRLF